MEAPTAHYHACGLHLWRFMHRSSGAWQAVPPPSSEPLLPCDTGFEIVRPMSSPRPTPPPPTTPPLLASARRTVLDAASLGVAAVRIPALLRCRDGRLVVFAEARHEGAGDTGQIDVIATVSHDGGRSFGAPETVAHGEGGTRGNPVPIEAADGDIVLLTTSNAASATERDILAGAVPPERSRRVHLTRLSPELAVREDREITAEAKREDWGWYATGPGHGIRLPSGRLVVAANHSVLGGSDSASLYGAHGLLSDDDGRTWRIGWVTGGIPGASGPNESALCADPADPSESLVTMRNEHRAETCTRVLARTRDGGGTLEAPQLLRGFAGPRLQAGLGALPGGPALLSAPLREEARRDLALHVLTGPGPAEPGTSEAGTPAPGPSDADPSGAACRPVGLLLEGPAGYSDLAVGPEAVHVLVETGDERPHERLDLITIDLPTALRAVGDPKEQHP